MQGVCVVAVGFMVGAGLARGCVHGLCYGLQGRCAQQGSHRPGFSVTQLPVGAHDVCASFLPAFMCLSLENRRE